MFLCRSFRRSFSSSVIEKIELSAVGGLENLKVISSERPLTPPSPRNAHDVVVQLSATAVCHRDLLDRTGAFPFIKTPIVQGHEGAGVVIATGEGVSSLKVNDRVVNLHWASCGECKACKAGQETICEQRQHSFVGLSTDGTYARFLRLNERGLVTVPEGFTAAEAATVQCTFGTAFHGLFIRAGLLKASGKQHILVTGSSGGVGTATVLMCKALGHDVTAVTRSSEKSPYLESLGVDRIIVENDVSKFYKNKQVRSNAPDFVVDCVGGPTFSSSLRSLRPGGKLLLLGNVSVSSEPLPLGLMIINELSVIGADSITPEELRQTFEFLIEHKIRPRIDLTLPLNEAALAQQRILDGKVQGRIVLNISDDQSW